MSVKHYFPVELQDLKRELAKPQNIRYLEMLEGQELSSALGTLLAEFGIVADGVYPMEKVCSVLVEELQRKDCILILPPASAKQ